MKMLIAKIPNAHIQTQMQIKTSEFQANGILHKGFLRPPPQQMFSLTGL